jgi:nicotinic acid mononucleotide adenylyltransferase
MCEKAIEPFGDKVKVFSIESELEPPYYSYKTLKKINETRENDDLYILCGNDVYGEMHNWMNSEWIFQHFKALPVSRNIIPISSTLVRNKAKLNLELYPYVPKDVKQIIKENKLYE